jgi:hypothetical protein
MRMDMAHCLLHGYCRPAATNPSRDDADGPNAHNENDDDDKSGNDSAPGSTLVNGQIRDDVVEEGLVVEDS